MLGKLKIYESKGLLYSQVHPTLPLSIWNYTDKVQWEGLWDEITLQCRGLIIDNDNNVILARPFKKFFNLSENKTTITDEYEIFEKLDGSLGILFFYAENWILASRGSFTSEQAIRGKELLDKYTDYDLLDKNNTYCFEIIYKSNKIVVDYGNFEGCILTAIFNTETGEEQSLFGHASVKSYNLETPLDKLHKVIKNTDEGYVIRFSNGERCKIKGAEYLRLHKMMSEMSTTAIWEYLRNGDSILPLLQGYPDEWYKEVKEYESNLKSLFKFWEETYKSLYINYSLILDIKGFAEAVKDKDFKHFMFSLRNGKDISKQIWNKLKPEYKRL